MAFVAHGAGVLRDAIDDNVGLAQLTYQQATAANDFETLGTPPDLSIVPLRYIPENVSDRSSFTSELAKRLVADGRIYISPATIDGQTWLRPCFTNFRTTADDVTVMFDVIREVGAQLAQES